MTFHENKTSQDLFPKSQNEISIVSCSCFKASLKTNAHLNSTTLQTLPYFHFKGVGKIHLCFEVDPMLECFLVVQRDPQIVSVINEVILGFPRHFPNCLYIHTIGERNQDNSQADWKGINPRKTIRISGQ